MVQKQTQQNTDFALKALLQQAIEATHSVPFTSLKQDGAVKKLENAELGVRITFAQNAVNVVQLPMGRLNVKPENGALKVRGNSEILKDIIAAAKDYHGIELTNRAKDVVPDYGT